MLANLVTPFDLIYFIVLFFLIISIAKSIQKKHISSKPYYKVYLRGLIIKTIGVIAFCGIYAFYYQGGDTVNYYQGVSAMYKVFSETPLEYIELLYRGADNYSSNIYINSGMFPPIYMFKDPRTYTVIKISSLFSIPCFGGFFSTTLLLSTFMYSWVWKLYTFLAERYPENITAVNISILFLPSTIFWGSGIMKDTFAFGATCYAVYGLHLFFIERKRLINTTLQLFFAFYLIITVKAYIMFALLPGLLIYANFERLRKIKSTFFKVIIIPFSIGAIFMIADTLFFDFNELFGKYSADKLLEEAAVQSSDLKRDFYGTNSFDIGSFEPTLQGAISKFFPAVNAAIFRPYIWESGSPTMLFSGLENSFLLLIVIWAALTSPLTFLRSLIKDPFLIFCLLFTLILGFGVGLSTSNFGALVRYKIPFLPFFSFLILKLTLRVKEEKTPTV